jgi:hypothetical protein
MVGVRTVSAPTLNELPDLYLILAASFTSWGSCEGRSERNGQETYLVEGRKDVVRELDLGNGSMTHGSHSYAKTSDTLFSEGGVEDAFFA